MSNFFLVTKVEFCDTLDRVQEQKLTVTIPVRWTPVLDIIEDDEEEEPPLGYDLEEGEIYESVVRRNLVAAMNFLNSLTLI
jgi:hypothetical protein